MSVRRSKKIMSNSRDSKLSANAFADDVIFIGVEKSYMAFETKIDTKNMRIDSNIQLIKTESEV